MNHWKKAGRLFCAALCAAALLPAGVLAAPGTSTASEKHWLTAKARGLFLQNQFREALEKYIAAYEANEDPPLDCLQQAVCYYKLGEQPRARQMFKFVVDKFPGSEPAKSASIWLSDTRLWSPDKLSTAPAGAAGAGNLVRTGARAPEGAAQITGSVLPSRIDVPYTIDPRGLIILPVSVNGQMVPTCFDTGAEITLFTTTQLNRSNIKLPAASGTPITLSGIGGQAQARRVQVDLGVGSLHSVMKIFVQDDTSLIRNQGATAAVGYPLLGQDFFGGLTFCVDDRAHVISFLPNGVEPRDPNAVSFAREGKLIVVKPKVNGREVEMILDTGAAAVSFSDLQLSSMGMSRPTGANHGAAVGIGGRRESYIFPLNSISLGPVEKKEVLTSCDIFGTGAKPLLGRTFFKGLKITVDPKARLLRLE